MQVREMDTGHDLQFSRRQESSKLGQLAEPLQSLPHMEFACAYGSGVFTQHRVAGSDIPMVDYILGVSSPLKWHSQNLEANPNHYSCLFRNGGPKLVCGLADVVGVGVHFNPYVPWGSKTIKYGVISTDNLVNDMLSWETLYVSGRLQKPVCFIVDNLELAKLNEVNLQAALNASLLLLPPEFSEEDLLTTICGISYCGDVRMLFAEDKNKVRNIVRGNAESFYNLYNRSIYRTAALGILSLPTSSRMDLQCKFYQDVDKTSRCLLLSSLPSKLLAQLGSIVGVKYVGGHSSHDISQAVLLHKDGCDSLLRRALGRTVRASSLKQMVSGFFAAGGLKGLKYVSRKVSKAWLSRQF